MVQTNLIFGIQEKIKAGKTGQSDRAGKMLEESTEVPQDLKKKELMLESHFAPSFAANIYQQTHQTQKSQETKSTLMTEAFHMTKAERKLQTDVMYFNYLFENFVDESAKGQFSTLLEGVFEDTIRLYQECDVTPRLLSPALDSKEITEAVTVDLYKNSLNKAILENYTKPILSGKINELYENEIRDITLKLIQEGVEADMDQVRIYLPFEESVYNFNRKVLIPEIAQGRMDLFLESTTNEYREFVEESAEDIMARLEQKIKLITSLISPNMFEQVVTADGVDAPKMAGISIITDKNFNDDDGPTEDDICPAEVAATDAEAGEEMDLEAEAEAIDSETSGVVQAENEARDEMNLVTDVDQLEDPSREQEAEISASEDSTPGDQVGAIEIETGDSISSVDSNGLFTNNSDESLSGEGQGQGTGPGENDCDEAGAGAELPGGEPEGSGLVVDKENLDADVQDAIFNGNGEVNEEEPDISDDDELIEDVDEEKEAK